MAHICNSMSSKHETERILPVSAVPPCCKQLHVDVTDKGTEKYFGGEEKIDGAEGAWALRDCIELVLFFRRVEPTLSAWSQE